jgi:hypothetical protein
MAVLFSPELGDASGTAGDNRVRRDDADERDERDGGGDGGGGAARGRRTIEQGGGLYPYAPILCRSHLL